MGYIQYNENPCGKIVGDCVIRAVSKVTGLSWDDIYDVLCYIGKKSCDMPNSSTVYGKFLRDNGFRKYAIPNTCPTCYTVHDFCHEHPYGVYVLCTGSHVIAVIDGNYYDAWDSGYENPQYYFIKEVY